MRTTRRLLTLSFLIALGCAPRATAASAAYWSWRNPLPQGNDYYDVTYGAGRFVAVGPAGTITTSSDGVTWVAANSGQNTYLDSIAYGNGRFVIVGPYLPGVLISDDGASWSVSAPVPDGWGGQVNRVTYAGDRFFATNNRDFVATSTDGVNWSQILTASAAHAGRIAFGAGGYVAQDMSTGRLSSGNGSTWDVVEAKMLYSADGITWVSGGATGLAAITAGPVYFDGRWVVGGTLVTQAAGGTQEFDRALSTSRDGGATWAVEWHERDTTASGNLFLDGLAVFGSRLFFLGNYTAPIQSTADLVTARADLPQQMIQLNAITASSDRIVAVGRYGQIVSSADGTSWTSPTTNTVSGLLRSAAFGDGRWIAAGDAGLATSPDGISWQMLAGATGFNAGAIAYGGGRFVATASDGRIGVSTDGGATWTDSATRAAHLQIAYAQGRFVGSVGLSSSADGLTWTPAVTPPGGTGVWTGVTTVGDVFYAVGSSDPAQERDGVIARSTDGLSWTVVATMSERVASVGGKDGLLVASGYMGEIWTSSDGVSWNRAAGSPLQSLGALAAVRGVGDSLVGATFSGKIVLSPDGTNWTKDEFASSGTMFGLASGNGQVIAVGAGGVIWEVGAARFTRGPEDRSVAVGSSVTLSVAAVGKEPLSYQWQKDGAAITGAKSKTYTVVSAAMRDAGSYSVIVSNSLGSTTSNPATLAVNQAATPPSITSQPESQTVNAGEAVTFSVAATGDAPLSYQWRKDNAAIVGATGSSYTIAETEPSDAGTYTVAVSNNAGTAVSNAASLVVNAPPAARLVNISTRAYATTNNGVTIGGFVISGRTPKQVLMRAVGPSLASQGLNASEVLADPTIELHHRTDTLATNDNWGDNDNAAEITAATQRLGARPLDAGDTRSAAMLMTLNPGIYTFVAKGKNDTSGIVLLEVYDADLTGSSFVNIASRAQCTTSNGVTIGGFVISGNAAKQVLMRAVGPTLTTQSLARSEVLLDPTIELHHGSAIVATNDNWGDNANASAIASVGARIGATPFASDDTTSSALLMSLQPGVYSFIAKGKADSSGLVLVEVYDAD